MCNHIAFQPEVDDKDTIAEIEEGMFRLGDTWYKVTEFIDKTLKSSIMIFSSTKLTACLNWRAYFFASRVICFDSFENIH